jgi:NAD(P)-dependent dehydrogenase (short-subunit alcohol dehydrogenase family)
MSSSPFRDLSSCLHGQVTVVTGASRGLGAAFARGLAARGAAVALFARSEALLVALAEELRAAGGLAVVVVGDASDRASIRMLVARTTEELGPIDLFVANAGVWGTIGPLWETDPEAWWRAMEINVKSPMLACHAVLPGMIARGRGRVILLSSHAGAHRWPTVSSYSCAKAAVNKLVENLGGELKGTGVSVFAYHPGLTTIGLTEEAWAMNAAPESWEGRAAAWVQRQVRMGHAVAPERSVAGMLALATGRFDARAGTYVTVDEVAPAEVGAASEGQAAHAGEPASAALNPVGGCGPVV